jgi:hypothetical protein
MTKENEWVQVLKADNFTAENADRKANSNAIQQKDNGKRRQTFESLEATTHQ